MNNFLLDTPFAWILFFALGGFLFLQISLWAGRLLRPKAQQSVEAKSTYECGEEISGSANAVGFSVRFYLLALAFILFEVEILFLFAWGLVVNKITTSTFAWFVLAEAFLFVFLLALGLAYLWKKGFLQWFKPEALTHTTTTNLHIPLAVYQKLQQD